MKTLPVIILIVVSPVLFTGCMTQDEAVQFEQQHQQEHLRQQMQKSQDQAEQQQTIGR